MIVWISILAVVAVGAGAYYVATKLQKAKQATFAEEVRQKMASVRDSSSDDTADRMRDGDF